MTTLTKPNASALYWAATSLLLCPAVAYAMLQLGGSVWNQVVPLANTATVWIFDNVGGFGNSKGQVAQALSVIFAAAVAALGPALALALSRPSWTSRAKAAAALFPGLLLVMCAPAAIIYENAAALDANGHSVRMSAEFLVLFSAGATALALAYSLWVWFGRDD